MKLKTLFGKILRQGKTIRNILNVWLLFLLFIFIYIEIQKPLWLDEIFSLLIIQNDSPLQIIKKLFLGSDTNAPLYFVLLKIFTFVFGSSAAAIKIFSVALTLFSFFIINKILNFFKIDFFSKIFVFSFLFVLPLVSTYLIAEVRSYPLLFLLEGVFIYFYFKFDKEKTFLNGFVLLIAMVALFYTHYYSFFFITPFLLYNMFYFNEKKSFFLIFFLAFVLFLPWGIAVFRQLQIGQGYTWHPIPTIKNVFFTYNFLFGKLGIILLLFFLLVVWTKKYLFSDKYFSVFILSLLILFMPLFNILLAYFRISVHSPRYFVGTAFSLLFLLIILFKNNLVKRKHLLLLMVIVNLWGTYRAVKVFNYVSEKIERNNNFLSVEKSNTTIVCESPHIFFPLNYYSMEKKGFSNFVLLMDSLTVFRKSNNNQMKFDFFLLKNYEKYYHINNIFEVNNFLKKHNEFYFIKSNIYTLFENRFINNKQFRITNIDSDFFYFERIK